MTTSHFPASLRLLLCSAALLALPAWASRAAPPGATCEVRFEGYQPSRLEQLWLDHVELWQHDVCAFTPKRDIEAWLTAVERYNGHRSEKFVETREAVTREQLPWSDALSTFTHRRTCTQEGSAAAPEVTYVHIPIEPTASICRDPRKCWEQMTERYTQSKEYLVALSAEAFRKVSPVTSPPPRSFLFDAGATIPFKQQENSYRWSGTDWIYTFYKNLGVIFDEVHAWEPPRGWRGWGSAKSKPASPDRRPKRSPKYASQQKKPPSALARRLVDRRSGRFMGREKNISFFPPGVLHFRNVGISTEANHSENPLAEIKRLCRPEDFVVFKLDIDSHFEIDVVRALLSDPELTALVDDFYYEHHVRNYVMRMHGLGNTSTPDPVYTLKGWYDLVTPARRKGLRMHFWP